MERMGIVITHETLFEILKTEKDRSELQKLDETFFNDVVSYIEDKKRILGSESELFSVTDKAKNQRQIDNAKKILKQLYDKREKKIISMALDKSRTRSDVIDISPLLKEEQILFDKLVHIFGKFRNEILHNILVERSPKIEESRMPEKEPLAVGPEPKPEQVPSPQKEMLTVRFISAVPKFVGKELEDYGPFEEDDIANLPREIAQVLIEKGRVEEIEQS